MKEVRPIGFEHYYSGAIPAYWNEGCSLKFSDLDIVCLRQGPSYSPFGAYVLNGKLRHGIISHGTNSLGYGMTSIRLGSLFGDRIDLRQLVIGFKITTQTEPASRNEALLGLHANRLQGDGSAGPQYPILSYANSVLMTGYYELVYTPYGDGQTASVVVFRDGEQVNKVPVSSGAMSIASLKNLYLTIGLSNNSVRSDYMTEGVHYQAQFEDMYVAWTNVLNENVRQGPITVKRLPVKEVDHALWSSTPGDKTTVEVLNTPNGVNPDNPFVKTDAARTPLRVKLDVSSLSATDRIVGITATSSARRNAGVVGKLATKWSANNNDSVEVEYSPTNAGVSFQKDSRAAVLSELPGGGEMNATSLQALELVLTPKP